MVWLHCRMKATPQGNSYSCQSTAANLETQAVWSDLLASHISRKSPELHLRLPIFISSRSSEFKGNWGEGNLAHSFTSSHQKLESQVPHERGIPGLVRWLSS